MQIYHTFDFYNAELDPQNERSVGSHRSVCAKFGGERFSRYCPKGVDRESANYSKCGALMDATGKPPPQL